MATPTLLRAAERVAALLGAPGGGLRDPSEHSANLVFERDAVLRPLPRLAPPADAWAVDGGQALVADARCLQVLVTRASRVRFQGGRCVIEEEGELRAHLLGGADERVAAVEALDLDGLAADTSVDVNLLRDRWEWEAVRQCVEEADAGALVLVDGDLQPDWRIPSSFLGGLLRRAAERGVVLAGITKHTSLARGGAPLIGQLELEAASSLGPRSMWWAPVASTRASARTDTGAGLQVVAARLDPDARFAFRVDLPAAADPAETLGRLAALCDDAAFPGYPYPLTVADRLAACPGWVRSEAWLELDELLARAGLPAEVRERAFTDRHRLMERS